MRRLLIATSLALAIGAIAASAQEPAPRTQHFTLRAENMIPALAPGERRAFDLDAYATGAEPKPGDIVLFRPPAGALASECGRPRQPEPRELCVRATREPAREPLRFVSRVVAIGGDEIAFRRGRVIRNGVVEKRKLRPCREDAACTFRGTITVPAGHVYLAGDNRGASDDSRFWGAIPATQLAGRLVGPP